MAVITFIGLGTMGAPMAGHLVRAGHVVRGFDISATARDHAAMSHGVTACSSLAEAL